MIPLVDMHCHLLAGLDDGPPTDEVAETMCRLAYEDGTRMVAATAHQNERWNQVTPERIRTATEHLARSLRTLGLGLSVFPCAEVMVEPDTEESWRAGRLMSLADRGQFLLIEMPHGLFVDLSEMVLGLREAGVRPILAHPERHEELLHEAGQIERLIEAGCLVQVSASSVAQPRSRTDAQALRSWFKRGVVHCLGSDGHSATRRPPLMSAAYRQIVRWVGSGMADRICSVYGMAILQGLPLRVPKPDPKGVSWFAGFWR
ncbi:MAG TPA: CpsB/CapC family capsule biosynthesis tyrosine phosphatase [Bryobacteraceae bacterium]|jgi:protein-tyrosine phosphatase